MRLAKKKKKQQTGQAMCGIGMAIPIESKIARCNHDTDVHLT
jgi:hypothetical protein